MNEGPTDIPAQIEELNASYYGIPVGPNSKQTLVKWKGRTFTTPELVYHARRGGNVGVRAGETRDGPRVIVVDRDTRKADSWKLIQRFNLHRRSNMQVETPGGWHLYFRLADGVEELRTRIKLVVNGSPVPIDVKATGYTLVFGSVDGRPYRFREGRGLKKPADLAELPESFLELVRSQTRREVIDDTRTKVRAVTAAELPQDRKVESARRVLSSRHFSIAGRGGDLGLFKAACLLIQFYRFDYGIAFQLLAEWNAGPNVQPPWPDQRLHYKLREAQRLNR